MRYGKLECYKRNQNEGERGREGERKVKVKVHSVHFTVKRGVRKDCGGVKIESETLKESRERERERERGGKKLKNRNERNCFETK